MTVPTCENCHRPLRRSPGPLGPKCARRESAAGPARSPAVLPQTRRSLIPVGRSARTWAGDLIPGQTELFEQAPDD